MQIPVVRVQTGKMTAIDLLRDLTGRPVDALDLFWNDLDPARLNVHPGDHPNSPAWLLWHAGREIDVQLAHLAQTEDQVWTSGGFRDRFGLGEEIGSDDLGLGHSPEQARAVRVPETEEGKSLLREYLEAVVDAVHDYLGTVSDEDLERVIDKSYDPPVTVGARLVSLADDALQHVGQAGYVAGMPRPD